MPNVIYQNNDIMPTDTEVLVCRGVPLDNKYNDTIYFTNQGAQQGYFRNKAKYIYNGQFTYQRVQNKVNNYSSLQSLPNPRIEFSCRVPVNADKIYDCNYLCFCNKYDTNKWFYCFIKEINYINPNCCEIIYEIDAIQTFFFDIVVMKSFVEREHTATDEYYQYVCLEDEIAQGEETLLNFENLSKGYTEDVDGDTYYHCLCANSDAVRDAANAHSGTIFEGSDLGRKINGLVSVGFPDRSNCFAFLKELSNGEETETGGGKSNECVAIVSVPAPMANGMWEVEATNSFLKPTQLDGYSFHNKMLCSFPFRRFVVVSSSGDNYEFRPQLFVGDGNPMFLLNRHFTGDDLIFSLKPNYQRLENKSKQLFLKTGQLGSWSSDAYQNWLAQNKGSLTAQFIGGTVNTIAGLAMMFGSGGIGAIAGAQNAGQGVRDLAQAFGRIADAKHLPDNVHGTFNNPNMEFELREMGFWFYEFCLDKKTLKRIDEYFTRYGYKVNEIKVPSPFDGHKRPKFNFVKTVDVNIVGSVPTPQMNVIKSAFDNGITFWHNPNEVGVYGEGENDV